MRTNDSVQRATIDRAAVAHYTYTTARGVPVAVMMGLVNALGAAPWFTMPHAANDDYVRTFATEVRALLPAGQHLAGLGAVQQDAAINRLFDAANRDARMGTTYQALLRQWQVAGGGLFVHFTDVAQQTPWGRWGALERVTETSSPKYDALLQAAQAPPPTDPITCFFNWAEQAYGHLFPRGQGAAGVLDPYTYRGYPTRPDATYLGTSRLDGHVWVLGPPTGGRLFDAGPLADWLRTSGCQ